MSLIAVVTLIPIPEHRDEVIVALEQAIAAVQAQDAGCELFALHEGQDGRLVVIEKWVSREAAEAHGQSPAFTMLMAASDGKLSAPRDVQVLTAHPIGSGSQGTL